LPSRDEVRRFIEESAGRVGKREIAAAFKIGPEQKKALRELLRAMGETGIVQPAGAKRFRPRGSLPETMLLEISAIDSEGDAIARPVTWTERTPPPLILMVPEPKGTPALAPGARVFARLRPISRGRYEARTIKRVAEQPGRVLGVYRKTQHGGRIEPTDRRIKSEWLVPPGEDGGAEPNEIVLAIPLPQSHALGLKPARIVERLGQAGDARAISLICIVTQGIPIEFPDAALAEAAAAGPAHLGARTDLRDVPLITIDGADARDFDDAVFAEPEGEGFRLLVAIADVAHYVPSGSALDRAARDRGNSVYFPDRVVPMLPEALSNGWCSLRPAENRGCLFVEIRIDRGGRKTGHRFGRGLMRSAARMTYEQVQAAADAGAAPPDLPAGLIPHLYGAFRALLAARQARGTLELDLPERKVTLDDQGRVTDIAPRPRLDSHRLIEEFMVLVNVCAAEELERLHRPCVYRVHAPPSDEKLDALRGFLNGLGISLPPGDQLHPRDLDHVLRKVADTPEAALVNEVMLRSQSQAAYSPDNIGHFGLALSRYAHFTSPIRRYADLLVHRALILGLRLGDDGLGESETARLADIAAHISQTERRAALAERDAIDRYLAAFMKDKIGEIFEARISGITRGAMFIAVKGSGANGLVPIATLPDDFWQHDERTQTLTGRHSGIRFHLAQEVDVRLSEANPVTGGLIFQILQGKRAAPKDGGKPRPQEKRQEAGLKKPRTDKDKGRPKRHGRKP
jgi:ribonuclease R